MTCVRYCIGIMLGIRCYLYTITTKHVIINAIVFTAESSIITPTYDRNDVHDKQCLFDDLRKNTLIMLLLQDRMSTA